MRVALVNDEVGMRSLLTKQANALQVRGMGGYGPFTGSLSSVPCGELLPEHCLPGEPAFDFTIRHD